MKKNTSEMLQYIHENKTGVGRVIDGASVLERIKEGNEV